MTKEDNSKENLIKLLTDNKITLEQYYFRLKANELNINTYKY